MTRLADVQLTLPLPEGINANEDVNDQVHLALSSTRKMYALNQGSGVQIYQRKRNM